MAAAVAAASFKRPFLKGDGDGEAGDVFRNSLFAFLPRGESEPEAPEGERFVFGESPEAERFFFGESTEGERFVFGESTEGERFVFGLALLLLSLLVVEVELLVLVFLEGLWLLTEDLLCLGRLAIASTTSWTTCPNCI